MSESPSIHEIDRVRIRGALSARDLQSIAVDLDRIGDAYARIATTLLRHHASADYIAWILFAGSLGADEIGELIGVPRFFPECPE